jgi:Fur family transcriptional regulator, ferric uptake regulator
MTHQCPDPILYPLEHHKDRLKHAGYKLTTARVTVLEAIEQLGGHVTSSQVLEAVNQRDDSIGRASVFRTLDLLTRLSIIRPTYIESSLTPCYVLLPNGHHHHVVCTSCNRVIEFEECDLEAMTQALEKRLNVKLTGHLLEFYGECADCQQKSIAEEF